MKLFIGNGEIRYTDGSRYGELAGVGVYSRRGGKGTISGWDARHGTYRSASHVRGKAQGWYHNSSWNATIR